jgi:hypothetical protein
MEFSHDFPPTPGSIPSGRHAIDRLANDLPPEVLDRIRVVVSELLGVSTRYADRRGAERIGMRIEITEDRARIEVSDLETHPDKEGEPVPSEILGLSLYLVDHLVDRWGVVPTPGPLLWAEIDLPPAS